MSTVINQDISIGANLKALRLRNKLSQEDVAAKLQVMGFTISREIISQMELGHHNIRVSVLLALKELYHATFDEIFADLSFQINDSGCGLLTKPAGRSKKQEGISYNTTRQDVRLQTKNEAAVSRIFIR